MFNSVQVFSFERGNRIGMNTRENQQELFSLLRKKIPKGKGFGVAGSVTGGCIDKRISAPT
jgi:hypothetical protein